MEITFSEFAIKMLEQKLIIELSVELNLAIEIYFQIINKAFEN